MYKIQFRVSTTKSLSKDIEKKIISVIENLQQKFLKQNRRLSYEASKAGDFLIFVINSDDYTATDLIVQFDKQVREILGKEFKTNLKTFDIKSYEIEEELEEMPKEGVSIPLVKKIEFKDKKVNLYYEGIPLSYIKDHYIERSLKLIKEKIRMSNYKGKDEFKEYVLERKQKKVIYTGDPAVDLEKNRWIVRTEAKGQFVYGIEFTVLVNILKELYIENVYNKLKFFEMIFPKFEPWEIPKKSGHAKNIYPSAYFVSVPKNSSLEYWQEVIDLYEITGEVQIDKISDRISCVGIMSYAQCPPFWAYLKNKIIDESTLPLRVYDWSGPTYRNESGGTHGLERVEEFNRIETLYVGTKEQVIKIWSDLKDTFIKFYEEVLDLEIRMARVTPWWMAHAGVKTNSKDLDTGTFDIEAYLPYRGERTKEWLEIQNVSSNGDKYPIAFNVKSKSQNYLWSGCAGASFQRVIVAFLAQKGPNLENWPSEIKKRFEKKIKNLKGLRYY